MSFAEIVRLVLAGAVVVAWWVYGVWGVLQWQDLHYDQVKARQKSMGRLKWKVTNWIGGEDDKEAKARANAIRWAGLAVGVVLFYLTWRATYVVTTALSTAVMVSGLRQTEPERDDIVRLRSALADIMKTDQPPKVTVDGDTLHIAAHPSFKEYQKTPRDAMEQAIEYRLDGDWELADWHPDGASTWTRIIHPPQRVDYTRHYDLPWHQLPLGVDGAGTVQVMDLLVHPHWVIAGNTRNGKTSILRTTAAHLLHHGVEIAAIDVKGGLSFLRGRKGVRFVATRRIDRLTEAMEKVRDEISERCDQFDKDGTYRKPLVVQCDEVATACIWAGGDNSPFATALLESIRLAGQARVFFQLSTQRPAAKAIPIEVRGQAEGRVAVGPMEQEVAQMMFEREWVKAVELRKVRGSTIAGDMSGQDNTEVQALWMADPHDTDHPKAERDLADNLLPPVVRNANTEGVTFDEPDATHREESKPKRELPNGITGDVTDAADASGAVTVEETPWQRYKRLRREAATRYRNNLPKRLLDPSDSIHGTKTGRAAGCLCEPCKTLMPRPKVMA